MVLPRNRGPDSREHVKTFDRRTDAKTWLENTTVSVATGSYVAPQRAKMTVGAGRERRGSPAAST